MRPEHDKVRSVGKVRPARPGTPPPRGGLVRRRLGERYDPSSWLGPWVLRASLEASLEDSLSASAPGAAGVGGARPPVGFRQPPRARVASEGFPTGNSPTSRGASR